MVNSEGFPSNHGICIYIYRYMEKLGDTAVVNNIGVRLGGKSMNEIQV